VGDVRVVIERASLAVRKPSFRCSRRFPVSGSGPMSTGPPEESAATRRSPFRRIRWACTQPTPTGFSR